MQVLFIFVFALIALQVFGQQSVALGSTMPSFLGFWNSFVAVFQILTLEVGVEPAEHGADAGRARQLCSNVACLLQGPSKMNTACATCRTGRTSCSLCRAWRVSFAVGIRC